MHILVLVPSYFPFGVAISSRMVNFCKLFFDMGHSVHVIALYSTEKKQKNNIYSMGCCTYQIATNKQATAKDSFLGNMEYIKAVKMFLTKNKVDAVFLCRAEPYFKKVNRLCRKANVPLYLEQCEWMDVSSYRFRWFDYRFIRRNFLVLAGYKSSNGVIAITRFLEKHYKKMGVPVVRIPTILDVKNIHPGRTTCNKKVTLIYTGNPSTSKEFLAPVINVLAEDEAYRKKFEFHIYGPSREKVIENIGGNFEKLIQAGDSVVIHGYVPQQNMEKIQREADYMLFIRPHRRSSDAGFPTKLGESMSVGTPVISNNTGDISMYLRNGENGFIMNSGNETEVRTVLEKIQNLPKQKYYEMRIRAREMAEKSFDYRVYQDAFKTIFSLEKM